MDFFSGLDHEIGQSRSVSPFERHAPVPSQDARVLHLGIALQPGGRRRDPIEVMSV